MPTQQQKRGIHQESEHFINARPYIREGTKEPLVSEAQKRAASWRDGETHDLIGIASQFSGADAFHQRGCPARLAPARWPTLQGRILDERHASFGRNLGMDPLDRYLSEGPSEQYAVHIRSDTAMLSTNKGCRCFELSEHNVNV